MIRHAGGTSVAVAGQNYSLSCSVIGAELLKPTITYCWYNESSNPRIRLVANDTLTLIRLEQYYTGYYTCEMTLYSPYLSQNLSRMVMEEIIVKSKLCYLNMVY